MFAKLLPVSELRRRTKNYLLLCLNSFTYEVYYLIYLAFPSAGFISFSRSIEFKMLITESLFLVTDIFGKGVVFGVLVVSLFHHVPTFCY